MTHPGEVLREEFLAPLGMSSHQLAEAIDVPPNRISEIVRENRSVTPTQRCGSLSISTPRQSFG